jgi:hypothetical protein
MQTFVWESFPQKRIKGHGEAPMLLIEAYILQTLGVMPSSVRSHKDRCGNYNVKFTVKEEDVLYCYRRIAIITKEQRELCIYDINDEVIKTKI